MPGQGPLDLESLSVCVQSADSFPIVLTWVLTLMFWEALLKQSIFLFQLCFGIVHGDKISSLWLCVFSIRKWTHPLTSLTESSFVLVNSKLLGTSFIHNTRVCVQKWHVAHVRMTFVISTILAVSVTIKMLFSCNMSHELYGVCDVSVTGDVPTYQEQIHGITVYLPLHYQQLFLTRLSTRHVIM